MAKVFVDTNLFIYALTESARPEDQGKRARTLQLLEELSHTEDIVTSLQVVNKCHYVLHRKLALPDVPAPIIWTRFCNSGRLSHGISLTGLEG